MAKIVKVRLGDIVLDESTQMRPVDPLTVNKYCQAFAVGHKFPPIVLERGTNRLVCGWHRVRMYLIKCGPDTLIECYFESYKDRLALSWRVAEDNAKHGRSLSAVDRRCIADKLAAMGGDVDKIGALLGVNVKRLEVWAGERIIVVGTRDGQTYEEPQTVKRSLRHLPRGQSITIEDFETAQKNDIGVETRRLVVQTRRHIRAGWVNDDEETLQELSLLHEELGEYLAGRGVPVKAYAV